MSRRIHSPFIQSSLAWSKAAAACVTPLEVERGDDLVDVHDLAAVVGRPTEQREVVAHRLGEIARVAELLERHRAVTLRELRPVRVRGSAAGGRRSAARRRRARRRSASTRWVESMRSSPRITCVMPISRSSTALARKKIGVAVGAHDHEVGDASTTRPGTSPRIASTNELTPVVGRAEADRARATLGARSRRALLGREVAARAVVARRAAGRAGCLVAGVELLGRAEALVGVPRVRAAGRPRRGTRSNRWLWWTGPSSQSRPSHRSISSMPTVHSSRDRLAVGVLDAEDERAVVVPREEPVEERGPHADRRAASPSAPARIAPARCIRQTSLGEEALGARRPAGSGSCPRRSA